MYLFKSYQQLPFLRKKIVILRLFRKQIVLFQICIASVFQKGEKELLYFFSTVKISYAFTLDRSF